MLENLLTARQLCCDAGLHLSNVCPGRFHCLVCAGQAAAPGAQLGWIASLSTATCSSFAVTAF